MLSINDIFDSSYYLETNPEVAEAVDSGEFGTALEHFEAEGVDQGLQFTPLIDLDYYKQVANPDLADLSNRQALDHLLEQGIDEGRLFSPFIELDLYKELNPDLADLSNSEALIQLRDFGFNDGLQFSSFANLEEYRSFSPELSELSLAETFTHLATFYAPEDEGRINIPLGLGRISIPDEVDIVTPETLEGSFDATITYSKAANEVVMEFDIEGLPFQLDVTRSEDVSTPFNEQPVSVEDGKWQIWTVGQWFTAETTFWYDGTTGDLIGNEFDLPIDPPNVENGPVDVNGDGIADTPFQTSANQAWGSEIFEGNPDGTANVEFKFDYDALLDERGSAGFYVSVLPYNLNTPEEVGVYYTQDGLPVSEAMSWDDVISTMQSSKRLGFFLTLEPDPKPGFLDSRDNTMSPGGNFYPYITPEGIVYDVGPNNFRPLESGDLFTHDNEPWPVRAAAIEEETELVFGSSEVDVFDAVDSTDDFDGKHDTIFTGSAADFVDASQTRNPIIPSTEGNNQIFGGTGADELFASHKDRLFGSLGDDILDASVGRGSNRLYGEEGNDELFAGSKDSLFAGEGDDLLYANTGSGDNRLYGEEGNDTFFVGEDDRLLGGEGDDSFFVGNGGDNEITGGAGADAFWIATGELVTEANTITDFELGTDVIGVAGIGATSIEQLDLTQVDNNSVISFSDFDLATLYNTSVNDLQTSDAFVFS